MDIAHDLDTALARMRFAVEPQGFTLVGFDGAPLEADLADLEPPSQLIVEADETTVLVREERAATIAARHPGARQEKGLRWIRFETPMGWELVGFLARITSVLAQTGVPIGAVCSFHRDHLFVGEAHLQAAREALTLLFPEVQPHP